MDKFIWILSLLFVSSTSAFAVSVPEVVKSSAYDYGMPSLFQLVFSLFFVIALIYTTGWVYQKLNSINKKHISKLNKSADSSRFTVLQSMSLGQQRHIYTIEMNGKILLIGSTPSQINLIKEFDKADCVDIAESSFHALEDNKSFASKQKEQSVNIDELYKKYKN